MGWFSKLFSVQDTAKEIVGAVVNTGDKLVYTDEEKADMKYKIMNFFPTLLQSYQPFKLAQRILAIWFSFLFGIAFLIGLAMECFNIYIKYDSLKNGIPLDKIILLDTQPLINIVSAFSIATIVLTIVGFYFFGGTIESYSANKKKD